MQKTPWHLAITLLTVGLTLLWAGCAGVRPTRPPAELLAQRQVHDAEMAERGRAFGQRILERLKARYDAYPGVPVVGDILVLSGGGNWGAFGAGVLQGWSRVHGPLAMPEFDVVTGVSTGALIAPFALLGDARSLATIVELYRHPGRNLVKQRWALYFLPANESFATVPGLERELRARVDMSRQTTQRPIPSARAARAWTWPCSGASRRPAGRGAICSSIRPTSTTAAVGSGMSAAQRAVESGDVERVHRILLASSGIPGAFPFREIGVAFVS